MLKLYVYNRGAEAQQIVGVYVVTLTGKERKQANFTYTRTWISHSFAYANPHTGTYSHTYVYFIVSCPVSF